MDKLLSYPIASDFTLQIIPPKDRRLSHLMLDRIEEIWNTEKALIGSPLFNGRLASALSFDEHLLTAELVEYKYYMAQMRDPAIKKILQLTPLGISGRIISDGAILIGRRSQKVFLDRGLYEAVPSGGVDMHALEGDYVNLRKQIEIELEEETGMPTSFIQQFRPLSLVKDPSHGTLEVCVELILHSDARTFPLVPNDEYSEFRWVSLSDLPAFLSTHAHETIPVTKWLLNLG